MNNFDDENVKRLKEITLVEYILYAPIAQTVRALVLCAKGRGFKSPWVYFNVYIGKIYRLRQRSNYNLR